MEVKSFRGSAEGTDAGLESGFVTLFNNFSYHIHDNYHLGRAFVRPYMCVIDRNVANGPTIILKFTATLRDDVSAKILAPNMAAPQTDAYLAWRHK